MCKKVIFGGAALVLIIGSIYSGFWFVQSQKLKQFTESAIVKANNQSNSFTIEYEKISSCGFPFKVKTHIEKLKISNIFNPEKNESQNIEIAEFSISSNLLLREFIPAIEKEMKMSMQTIDENNLLQNLVRDINFHPHIKLLFSQSPFAKKFKLTQFKSFNYQDDKIEINNEKGEVIFDAVLHNKIHVNDIKTYKNDIKYDIKIDINHIKNQSNNLNYSALDNDIEIFNLIKTDLFVDLILNIKENNSSITDFDIKKFNLSNNDIAIDTKGNIAINVKAGDLIPMGNLDIWFVNYKKLLNYFQSYLKNEVKFLEETLPVLASEKSNNDHNLLIKYHRGKDGKIMIGSQSLEEIIGQYATYIGQMNNVALNITPSTSTPIIPAKPIKSETTSAITEPIKFELTPIITEPIEIEIAPVITQSIEPEIIPVIAESVEPENNSVFLPTPQTNSKNEEIIIEKKTEDIESEMNEILKSLQEQSEKTKPVSESEIDMLPTSGSIISSSEENKEE